MSNRKNAFDLLRILLAIGVLITHGIIIGGYRLTDPLSYLSKHQSSLGEFCVMGFFTLSGYLISSSFARSKNVVLFASHRLLRIIPGFWVSLLVTGFIIAPLIFSLTGNRLSSFLFTGKESAFDFFTRNMLFSIRQWSIRDVLNHSAYQGSLNGSLWSLLPELQCYFFTVVAGTLGLFQKNKSLLLIVAVVIFIFFAINFNFSKTYGPTILIYDPALKLFASYLAGTLIFTYQEHLILDIKGTIFLSLFILMLIKFGGYNILSPLLIALVLINSFQFFEFKVKYDISYGIYIYSFPVEHLVHVLFKHEIPFFGFILISLLISVILGFISYLVIERPFIRLRQFSDPVLSAFSAKTGAILKSSMD